MNPNKDFEELFELLYRNKSATGRDQDKLDVKNLKKS